MARNATTANITAIQDALQSYVDAITVTAVQAMAQFRLNIYLDALTAFMNINASAASSYSTSVGASTQKRRLDDARQSADAAYAEFSLACSRGNQTIPVLDDNVAYWDLSGLGI